MFITGAGLSGGREKKPWIATHKLKWNKGKLESDGFKIIYDDIYTKKIFSSERSPLDLYAISRSLSYSRALDLKSELEDYILNEPEFSENISLRLVKGDWYHLIAEGNYSSLKNLLEHKQFTMNGSSFFSSVNNVKRQLNIPFSKLKTVDSGFKERHFVDGSLSLEEFCSLKFVAYDDEFAFWWDQEDLSVSSLKSSDGEIKSFLNRNTDQNFNKNYDSLSRSDLLKKVQDYFTDNYNNFDLRYFRQPMTHQFADVFPDGDKDIIHYFSHLTGNDKVISRNLESGPAKIKMFKSDDSLEMIIRKQKLFERQNIIGVISQNGMSYDFLEERSYLEREKKLQRSLDKSERKKVPFFSIYGERAKSVSAGFFKKVVVPSVIHIDLAPYSQNHWPFTIDNKFATLVSLVTGKSFEKSQDYGAQILGTLDQIISGKEQEEEIIYGSSDVSFLARMGEYILPIVYMKSKLFECLPEDVCVTSVSSLALKHFRNNSFEKSLSIPYINSRSFDDLSSPDLFQSLLPKNLIKNKKVHKDFSDSALYYFAPFTTTYKDYLLKNPVVKDIFSYIKNLNIDPKESSTKNTLTRFDLLRTIEEGFLLPHLYDQKENNFPYYKKNISNMVEAYTELFSKFKPSNFSNNFFCFPSDIANSAEFESAISHLGFRVAEGKLVSFSKASFALYDGVNIFKQGLDVKGTRGFKTLYQEDLIASSIDLMFKEGPESALGNVSDFIQKLKSSSLSRYDMIHLKKKVARDFLDYSSPSHRELRVKAYIESQIKEGQTFSKVILSDGWHEVEDFLDMPDSRVFSDNNINFLMDFYFGKKTTKGRSLASGKVSPILRPLLNNTIYDEQSAFVYLEQGNLDALFSKGLFSD